MLVLVLVVAGVAVDGAGERRRLTLEFPKGWPQKSSLVCVGDGQVVLYSAGELVFGRIDGDRWREERRLEVNVPFPVQGVDSRRDEVVFVGDRRVARWREGEGMRVWEVPWDLEYVAVKGEVVYMGTRRLLLRWERGEGPGQSKVVFRARPEEDLRGVLVDGRSGLLGVWVSGVRHGPPGEVRWWDWLVMLKERGEDLVVSGWVNVRDGDVAGVRGGLLWRFYWPSCDRVKAGHGEPSGLAVQDWRTWEVVGRWYGENMLGVAMDPVSGMVLAEMSDGSWARVKLERAGK